MIDLATRQKCSNLLIFRDKLNCPPPKRVHESAVVPESSVSTWAGTLVVDSLKVSVSAVDNVHWAAVTD